MPITATPVIVLKKFWNKRDRLMSRVQCGTKKRKWRPNVANAHCYHSLLSYCNTVSQSTFFRFESFFVLFFFPIRNPFRTFNILTIQSREGELNERVGERELNERVLKISSLIRWADFDKTWNFDETLLNLQRFWLTRSFNMDSLVVYFQCGEQCRN